MNGNTPMHTCRTCFSYLILFLLILPLVGCGKKQEIPPQEKIKNLKAQVKDTPDDPEAHYALGVMYLVTENYAEAVNQFKDTVRLKKDHAPAYRDMAVAYYFSNQLDETEKWLKKAYGLNTKDPSPLISMGGLSLALGHNVEATKYLSTALVKEGNHLDTHINMGAAFTNLTQNEKALKQLQKALELDENSAPAHNNMGVLNEKTGQRIKAIEEFNKAIKADPKYPMPHYNLGAIYAKEKKYQQAISEWKKAAALAPKDSFAHAALGWAYAKLDNPKDALSEYNIALQINPSDALSLGAVGKMYLEEGRVSEATDALEKAVNLKLDYGEAYYNLGRAYDTAGDGTKAIINMIAAQKVFAFKKNASMKENTEKNIKTFYDKYKLSQKDFAGIAMPAILQEAIKPPPKKKNAPAAPAE